MTRHEMPLNSGGRPSWWQRAWGRVKEPRVITFLTWLGYVALTIVGAYALVNPPSTVEGALGPFAMYATAGMVFAGGLAGVAGTLPGWREMERLGIASILGGSAIYSTLVLILHFTEDGNRSFQAGFIIFGITSLASRWVRIKDHTFEPGSRASERAIEKHPEVRADTGSLKVLETPQEYALGPPGRYAIPPGRFPLAPEGGTHNN